MNITITKEAKENILSKDSSITLELARSNAGCRGTINIPEVKLGEPDNHEGYKIIREEEIKIFINPNIQLENLQISLNKVFFKEKLSVNMINKGK